MTVPQPFQYPGSQRAQQKQKLKSETLKPEIKNLTARFTSCSAAVLGGRFGHRPGVCFWNWRRDAAATRRRGRLRYQLHTVGKYL
jgi:hypothetical protein